MKNKFRAILALLLVFITAFSLTACTIDVGDATKGDGANDSDKDYMTREEVEDMLSGIEENVTVNAGDNYDIEINSQHNGNLVAASKALLSAVSISATFDATYNYGGKYGTYTKEETYYGAGVIYSLDKEHGDAYIITNCHVVYNQNTTSADHISDDIKVYLYGKDDPTGVIDYSIPAKYVGGSVNYDIAVLKVENSDVLRESSAIAATFADSNNVSVLDTAIAIGNPASCGISATVGAVNIDSERIKIQSIDGAGTVTIRVMRTDAAVNSGNSGGGLFNDKGDVIGIVNAKMSSTEIDNIGYAIPSNVAKYVADNIIYYDNLNSENDSVYRLILGVNVAISDADAVYDTETGKVHKRETVAVSSVVGGSIADGKLQKNDVISAVTVDGVRYDVVRTFNVIDIMLTVRKNSTVVFSIVRDGTAMEVSIDTASAELVEY